MSIYTGSKDASYQKQFIADKIYDFDIYVRSFAQADSKLKYRNPPLHSNEISGFTCTYLLSSHTLEFEYVICLDLSIYRLDNKAITKEQVHNFLTLKAFW